MTPVLQGLIEGTNMRLSFEREARAREMMDRAQKQQEIENSRQDARDLLEMLRTARPVQDGMIDAPMQTPNFNPITGAEWGTSNVAMTKAPVDPGRVVAMGGRQFEAMTQDELAGRETDAQIRRARALLPVDRERAITMGMVAPEVDKQTVEQYGDFAPPEVVQTFGLSPDQRFSPQALKKFSEDMVTLARQARIEELKTTNAAKLKKDDREFTADQKQLDRTNQKEIAGSRNATTLSAAAMRGAARAASSGGGGDAEDEARLVADAIIQGEQPPEVKGYGAKGNLRVKALLSKSGYNLSTAQKDWEATRRHLATLNGNGQERLRQAIGSTYEHLDQIEQLFSKWEKVAPVGVSGVRLINRAQLSVAKQLPGEAGATAQALESQINDLVSEMATVYRGGNASTDQAMKLAAENLKGDWNKMTFQKNLQQLRQNLAIRKNSMMTSEPAGLSTGARAGEPAAPAGPVTHRFNPQTGKVEEVK